MPAPSRQAQSCYGTIDRCSGLQRYCGYDKPRFMDCRLEWLLSRVCRLQVHAMPLPKDFFFQSKFVRAAQPLECGA
jgi:hypothetical protein